MSATVIYGDRPSSVASATPEGNNLWLSLTELHKATGWELKPQGACLNDVCMPIPVDVKRNFSAVAGNSSTSLHSRACKANQSSTMTLMAYGFSVKHLKPAIKR